MINPKYIGIAAGVGFVLSFLIGIFSGISFGLLLLRALICAAIFAAVGTGGSILYQKFLSYQTCFTPAFSKSEIHEKPVDCNEV